MSIVRHGTISGYSNSKCRCDQCRGAWAGYMQRKRADTALGKRLQSTYGISIDDFLAIMLRQNGKCGICKREREDLERDLYVDHDHATGRVRGLLCSGCNTGLGALGDDMEGVLRALDYLRASLERPSALIRENLEDFDQELDQVELVVENTFVLRIGPGVSYER